MSNRKTTRRLMWAGYATILRQLQLRPMTADQVAEFMGCGRLTAWCVLNRMHDMRVIRISAWVRPHRNGVHTRVFSWGSESDAPCPDKGKAGIVRTTKRHSVRPELMMFVSIVKLLMDEPCTRTQISEQTGACPVHICHVIRHCKSIGLMRTAGWEPRQGSGGYVELLGIGSQPPAPKPRPQSRYITEKRYRESKAAKTQMLAVLSALAGKSQPALEHA